MTAVVNHVGHCVTDLDRSRRFYEAVFGFRAVRELAVPDGPASTLLRVAPPVGLTALYLQLGATVLELLHFERPGDGAPPGGGDGTAGGALHERAFTDPGLTHLSFSVDDVGATCELVVEHGGTVLADTDVGGLAIMVRDPDGQLLELLPLTDRADRA